MIKATYDTNILASGTTVSHRPISFMIDAWINDEVQMITSQPLIDELTKTLSKSYFISRLTPRQTRSEVYFPTWEVDQIGHLGNCTNICVWLRTVARVEVFRVIF